MSTDYKAMMKDVREKNKNDVSHAKMHEEWNKLRQEILGKINAIDKATPWSEKHPTWRIEMYNVRRTLFAPAGTVQIQ